VERAAGAEATDSEGGDAGEAGPATAPLGAAAADASAGTDSEAEAQLLLSRLEPSPSGDEAALPVLAARGAAQAGGECREGRAEEREEADYEDVFEMMMNHWPGGPDGPKKVEAASLDGKTPPSGQGDDADGQEGQGSGAVFLNPKRPRLHPPEQALAQDLPAASQALAFRERGPEEPEEEERPPEKIVEAYARLDVPFTATVRDVERRIRHLSRHAHPDKVPSWLRPQASTDFRELQDAKAVVLTWMRERRAPEDSDSPVCDATSDEEGGMLDPNHQGTFGEEEKAEGYESPDSERLDEMKACGAREPNGERCDHDLLHGDSSADEQDLSGCLDCEDGPGFGIALAGGAFIRSDDGALDQAMSLSRFRAGGAPRKRACSECYEREVEKGADVCRQCQVEMKRLWRRLGGGDELDV